MHLSIISTGLTLAALVALPGAADAASVRPNIIYIMADDQGFGDVAALNAESKIPTP
ncbi:MAG: Cerebroside-sulfatase, partial [Planctomycetota bacterium]|nr:Cerebroside-sulfatase [Planctomycetota bacterium]